MDVVRTLDVVGVVLLALVLVLGGFALRRRILQRKGGTFDCSLRKLSRPAPKGWMLGVGRYERDLVEWYRVFSFSPRPRQVVVRRDLHVRERRAPNRAEALALPVGARVLVCEVADEQIELGMSDDALTGFLAWLESAPPGQHSVVA